MYFANAYFDSRSSKIHHFYYDESGKRHHEVETFSPFLFVQSEFGKPQAISIFNEPLRLKKFSKQYYRTQFIQNENRGKPTYFNLPPDQQYIFTQYQKTGISTSHSLRCWYLDIEIDINLEEDRDLDVEGASKVINLISCHDSKDNITYTWGLGESEPFDENHVYYAFDDEVLLISDFLKSVSKKEVDVLITWNGETFDIPYIVHRAQLLGLRPEDMSPVGQLYSTRKRNRKRNTEYTKWNICGISHVDYMLLFEYMHPSKLERYALDFVTREMGLKGKVEYEQTSLYHLSRENWDKFVEYNIQDVRLMVELEEKKSYLQISRNLVAQGYCNLDHALGKVRVVEGCLAKSAWDKGKIIVTNKFGGGSADKEDFTGGYVRPTLPGIHKGVVIFDVNSLYPNTMITINISPEMKRGKILDQMVKMDQYSRKNEKWVKFIYEGKTRTVKEDTFFHFLQEKKCSLSPCGVIFDQTEKGIIPDYLDRTYKHRVALKERMKSTADEDEIKRLDNEQYAVKILINSVYGATGCQYFAMYDLDCAESVTTSGQVLIKKSADDMDDLVGYECNVAGDTDSIMCSILQDFHFKDGKVTSEGKDLLDALVVALNSRIKKFCEREYLSIDSRCEFGWEVASDYSLFLKKKTYAMHVCCDEGKDVDEYKYRGMTIRKSIISEDMKDILRDIVENFILAGKSEQQVKDRLLHYYQQYKSKHVDDVSIRKACRGIKKYGSQSDGLRIVKGCPGHVKSALSYNFLVEKTGMKKYPIISEGDDIKEIAVKPNSFGVEKIAYTEEFPYDIGIQPDIMPMWEKSIESGLKSSFEVLKWKFPRYENMGKVDLFAEFS